MPQAVPEFNSIVLEKNGSIFIEHFSEAAKEQKTNDRVLIVVHGLGEYGGRYRHLPQHLAGEFSDYYALDLRGHGRSAGLRGHIDRFEEFLDDIKAVCEEVRLRHQKSKLFLLAHSFGGLVALRYLIREEKPDLCGVVLSAPFLGIAAKVPRLKKLLGDVGKLAFPKLQISNEVNPSFLSHDPNAVFHYVQDRLVHDKITPGLYGELTKAQKKVTSFSESLSVPALFLIPGDDRLVDAAVTRAFFHNLKMRHKALKEFPGFYHEVLNEVGKESVFQEIREWIKQY